MAGFTLRGQFLRLQGALAGACLVKHRLRWGGLKSDVSCPRFRGGLDGQHGNANVAAGLKSF